MKTWRNPHVISFSHARADFVSGRRTPRDFLEQCVDVISAREEGQSVRHSECRRGTDVADAATRRYRSGTPLSPVDGCPIAIKDIIATADMPTQMNSPLFDGWQPRYDAACVAALRQGGAVIVGKTVTTEFAIARSGPTTNPFDPERTPGALPAVRRQRSGPGWCPPRSARRR